MSNDVRTGGNAQCVKFILTAQSQCPPSTEQYLPRTPKLALPNTNPPSSLDTRVLLTLYTGCTYSDPDESLRHEVTYLTRRDKRMGHNKMLPSTKSNMNVQTSWNTASMNHTCQYFYHEYQYETSECDENGSNGQVFVRQPSSLAFTHGDTGSECVRSFSFLSTATGQTQELY